MYNGLEWSPRAQKARREAQGRARGFWPALLRTHTHLILRRPTRGSGKYQAGFASYVKRELLAFTFNNRRNWWEADLTVANAEAAIVANTNYRELQLNLSQGVRAWLNSERPGVAAQTVQAQSPTNQKKGMNHEQNYCTPKQRKRQALPMGEGMSRLRPGSQQIRR